MRRAIWRRAVLPAALGLLVAGVGSGATASSGTRCAGPAAGGEWTSYGGDLRNTRHQPREKTIGVTNAAALEEAWTFVADGTLHTTPVTGGGCVYAADDNTVYALNADTGQLVWKHRFQGFGLYSVAYSQGRVYVNINIQGQRGPSGAALDARTGRVVYVSAPVHFGVPSSSIASAVAWGRYQLVVTTGGDGATSSRPGVGLLDGRTGKILAKKPFVGDAATKRGEVAGGMWATPAVDARTGFAYGATGDPPSSRDVPYCCQNSLVKIDVDPRRRTAGSIVDWYAGTPDTFVGGVERQTPVCDTLPQPAADAYFGIACLQQDLDFGASPLLVPGPDGRLLLADLQKSGEFHVVDAGTMAKMWSVLVPAPLIATGGNTASPASDGKRFYFATNPGVLQALDVLRGTVLWRVPDPGADNLTLHPPAVANGVLYKIGTGAYHGGVMALEGFDAATGLPLFYKPIGVENGNACIPYTGSPSGSIGGVAVARNTVYAACDATAGGGGTVVAYRLPR